MLCATANTALITTSAQNGTGHHAINLTDYRKIESTKFNWLSQGFHVMSTNWGKVSVGLFLLRIIEKVKHHKPVMYAGIFLLTIIHSFCVYTIYGQCTPTVKLWDSSVDGSCLDPNVQKNYAFFQGSSSAVSDFILVVYPLFTIWNLQSRKSGRSHPYDPFGSTEQGNRRTHWHVPVQNGEIRGVTARIRSLQQPRRIGGLC
ncbi:hypothetical protein BDW59DRAFT_151623 [Aspergillus cavernicola]|uniref:Rhodopsin domain-containing protein n=1 Tax=Aspergillus cavernicola TaxID=176166 RepID=A0ABR4HV85_9EURO